MRCPNCGRELPAGVLSCPYCQVVLSFAVPSGGQASPGQFNPYVRVQAVRGLGLAAMITVGVGALSSIVSAVPVFGTPTIPAPGESPDQTFLTQTLGYAGLGLLFGLIGLCGLVLSIIW